MRRRRGCLQVVVVFAATFGGDLARVEEGLHFVPGVDVDEGFVCAGVFGSFVADDADVVRVAEQFEEPGACNRTGRALRCRHRGQAAGGGFGEQIDDCTIAGCVLLEHPADQWGAF